MIYSSAGAGAGVSSRRAKAQAVNGNGGNGWRCELFDQYHVTYHPLGANLTTAGCCPARWCAVRTGGRRQLHINQVVCPTHGHALHAWKAAGDFAEQCLNNVAGSIQYTRHDTLVGREGSTRCLAILAKGIHPSLSLYLSIYLSVLYLL